MIDDVRSIKKYFPLTEAQSRAFERLVELHQLWSKRLNLMSQSDIAFIWTRHVLHSLSIAKISNLEAGSVVLDIGTGGGFPTIPLAILHPDVVFHCIDGRSRKINAVKEIVADLQLDNVKPMPVRAEDLSKSYQIIMARAVASVDKLVKWSRPLAKQDCQMLFFKGGDFGPELRRVKSKIESTKHVLSDLFEEPYFSEKYLLELTFTRH